MGGVAPPVGYNLWRVGAHYSAQSFTVPQGLPPFLPCNTCVNVNTPAIPSQPAAIPGAPNSPFLHVSYNEANSISQGCTPPPSPTASFLAADGQCYQSQIYFAKYSAPGGISIPAGTNPVQLSFFWLCVGGAQSFGEVLYSTTGPTGPWFGLTSSVTSTAQLRNRSTWQADTITLPIARPSNLWIAFRFVNNNTTAASDPPLAVDAVRVFERVVASPVLTLDNATPNPVCAGSTLTVTYTAQNFPPGTVYTAQLLDGANNIVASASGASPIALAIPATTPSGTYTLRVQANTNPVTNSNTLPITVVNVQSLSCSANPNPTQPGTAVTLTLNGTNLPAGPFNIQMNPGDGSPVQSQNGVAALPHSFNHTYAAAGTYTVTFTITHPASGCTGTCQVPVTVQPPTGNTIDLVSVNPASVCAGGNVTVTFTPSGTFNAGNLFRVQLSDGSGSFATPQNIGVGAASPIVATVPAATPSGTYKVRVVSTSPVVISDTADLTVVNLSGLTCGYNPTPALAGTPTSLTLAGNGLPGGVFNILLDANGDGTPDYTQNGVTLPHAINHTYPASGTYTATFTVTHVASGCTGTCNVSVQVQGQGLSALTLSPSVLCAGETFSVSYTSSGVTFNPGNTFTVEVRDGGGNVVFSCPTPGTSVSGSLSCTVPAGTPPGTYTVQVSSSDPVYSSGTLSLTVSAPPVADFAPDANLRFCLGTPIAFTDRSQNAVSVRWDFGDGATSTDRNPTHTYTAPGSYTVTLTAQVSSTCTDQLQRTVEILPLPTAAFTAQPPSLLLPEQNTLTLTNTSSGAATYQWDFGNGQTSTAPNPT
ncbi:MAG: PKD domain-containing protein, partial [Bacteroidia bacterium]|nr:PKD domain-containing protein [Bacteroidia bacterium]